MVKRSSGSPFMPHAHVFPGGRVDPADAEVEIQGGVRDQLRLDVADAAAFQAAAVRETYEEAGILLANGQPDDALRTALQKRELGFAQAAAQAGWVIDADDLHYWSWWVTPKLEPRRYSARFFIAVVPEGTAGDHDDYETVESAWWTIPDCLARFDAGEILLAPPTWYTLFELQQLGTIKAIVGSAGARPTPPIEPTGFIDDEGMTLILPGDPEHPADFSLPGPSRVQFSQGRWLVRR